MSRASRLLRDVAISGLSKVLLKFRGLLLLPVIVKLAGEGTYGVWVQVTFTATFVGGVFGLALHSSLVRFLSPLERREERASVYLVILLLAAMGGLAGACFQAGLSPFLSALLLGTSKFARAFAIGGLFVPLYVLGLVNLNFFRATDRIPLYNLLDVSTVVLEVGSIWVSFALGGGVETALLVFVLWRALFLAATTALILRWTGLSRPSWGRAGEFVGYSLPLVPAQLSTALTDRADRFVVGHFWGPEAVGIYSAACTVCRAVLLLAHPAIVVLFPEISRRWDRGEREGAQRLLAFSVKLFLLLALPLALLFSLHGHLLVLLLGNARMAAGASPLLPLIASGFFLMGLRDLVDQALMMLKWTKASGALRTGGSAFNLGLNLLLVPRVGMLGAAVAVPATYALCLAGSLLIATRGVRVAVRWPALLRLLGGALPLGFLSWLATGMGGAPALVVVAVGLLVYAALAAVSGLLSPEEREALRRAAGGLIPSGRP